MLDNKDLQAIAQLIQVAVEPLHNNISAIKEEITETKADIANIKEEISNIKEEVTETKADIANIKEEISNIKEEVAETKADIANIKEEISNIKEEVAETKADIANIKEEVTGTKADIALIKGEITSIKQELTNIRSDMHDSNEFLLSEMERLYGINARKIDKLFEEVSAIKDNKETTDYLFQQLAILKKRIDELESKIA